MFRKNKKTSVSSSSSREDIQLINAIITVVNKEMKAKANEFRFAATIDSAQHKILLIEQIMGCIYTYAGITIPRYKQDGQETGYLLTSPYNFSREVQRFPEIIEASPLENPKAFVALVDQLSHLINRYDSTKEKKAEKIPLIGNALRKYASTLPGFKKSLEAIIKELEVLKAKGGCTNNTNNTNNTNIQNFNDALTIDKVLPKEIIGEVCSFLEVKEVEVVSQLCKFFNSTLNENDVWKNFLIRDFPLVAKDKDQLEKLLEENGTLKAVYQLLYLQKHYSAKIFFCFDNHFDAKIPSKIISSPLKVLNSVISSNRKLNEFIFQINEGYISSREEASNRIHSGIPNHFIYVVGLNLTVAELKSLRINLGASRGVLNDDAARSLDLRDIVVEVSQKSEPNKPECVNVTQVKFSGKSFELDTRFDKTETLGKNKRQPK